MGTLDHLYPEHLLLLSRKNTTSLSSPGLELEWVSPDTKESFDKHIKTQPASWYYRTNTISYKYNSNNYRCPEWDNIVWEESWIIMGCSFVEGIGLIESDSLPCQLSKLISEPVINLGVSGSSTDVVLFNTIRLTTKGIRPKGVIILNGNFSLARLSVFTPEYAVHTGPWVVDWPKTADRFPYSTLYDLWTTFPSHAEAYSQMCLQGAVAIWKCENIPVFHVNVDTDLSLKIDYARDLKHPGRATFLKWAREIAKKLKS
jgi:hypothetical protein